MFSFSGAFWLLNAGLLAASVLILCSIQAIYSAGYICKVLCLDLDEIPINQRMCCALFMESGYSGVLCESIAFSIDLTILIMMLSCCDS